MVITILAISHLFQFSGILSWRILVAHENTICDQILGLFRKPLEEPQVGKHVAWIVTLPQADTGRYPLHLPLCTGASLTFEADLDHA